MYAYEIDRRLRKEKHFIGSYPINRLPLLNFKPISIIINLDPAYKPGSHWVAAYFPNYSPALYFDPLGNNAPPLIASFMDRNSHREWISKNWKIQPENSFMCGYYCVEFIKSCPQYDIFFGKFRNCNPNNDEILHNKLNNYIK